MVQYELATNTENYQCIIHYIWFKNIILGPVHASLELQPYDWGFSWCNENKTQVSVTLKMRAWQIKMGMCLMCIDIFVSQSSDDIYESVKSCKKSFKFNILELGNLLWYGKKLRIWFTDILSYFAPYMSSTFEPATTLQHIW